MNDIADLVERLKALVDYIEAYPLDAQARERTTFRQIQKLFASKQESLGLDFTSWDESTRENAEIRYWMEQLGMAMDERGLIEEDHHLDLPLNFQWMDQYKSMRDAEEAFWGQWKAGVDDRAALLAIVKQYAPTSH